MATTPLSPLQFAEMTRSLLGQPISRTWRGYGSAIFFEVGELSQYESKRRNGVIRLRDVGEVTIMIEWSWRVEKPRSIAFGSWNTKRQIENGIPKLQGSTIESIELKGRLPEIEVGLSGGRWVHSFMTTESQPEWSVLWTNPSNPEWKHQWIHCKRGQVVLSVPDERV